MGMFDNVPCRAMSCPGCGGDLDWQTKDAGCSLATVLVVDVMHGRNEMRMIGGCDECRWSIEAVITRNTSPTVKQLVMSRAEAKGLGLPTDTEGREPVGFVLLQRHECDFESCDGSEETMGLYATIADAQAGAESDAESSIGWQSTPGSAVYLTGYPTDRDGDLPGYWEYIIVTAADTEGGPRA
ncbi:hypothetical protein [Nocardia sp. NPDC049149]|uniref:hypothetical protein n=1 Tax=Nocardia sp. NPDC049149 TaxID=3364315 RepID=UPI003719B63F